MKSVGIREARGQSVNMTLFFVLRCCTTIREGMKRMLGRDKNRVLWQSTDFFSGERNRKLASTAACITELEMCVGSHATSFSLYFLLSHYLSFSLSRSTHTLTHSRSQPTLHISVHGSPGRYTVLLHNPWIETKPAFLQKWHTPKLLYFYLTVFLLNLFFVYLPSYQSILVCCFSSAGVIALLHVRVKS